MAIRKRLRHLAVVLAIAFTFTPALMAVSTEPVAAVTCSGFGCDGQYPTTTGCDASGYTVASAYIYYLGSGPAKGIVELRASSVCKTRWARVTAYSTPNAQVMSEIYRSGVMKYREIDYNVSSSAYGKMVYVGTSYSSRACGSVTNYNTVGCTGTYWP